MMFKFRKAAATKQELDQSYDIPEGYRDHLLMNISPDGTRCQLQVIIDGRPGDWITFNAEELDRVIAGLQEKRAKLGYSASSPAPETPPRPL